MLNILQLTKHPTTHKTSHNKELPSLKLSEVEKFSLYFHELPSLPTFYDEEPREKEYVGQSF